MRRMQIYIYIMYIYSKVIYLIYIYSKVMQYNKKVNKFRGLLGSVYIMAILGQILNFFVLRIKCCFRFGFLEMCQ